MAYHPSAVTIRALHPPARRPVELKIDRLSKTYANGVHALRDVSLTIAPGMFGLLGPNGAGKSTLMRILATLQEADAGFVRLGDIDVLRDKEAVRRTLGYLPQEFGLYPQAPRRRSCWTTSPCSRASWTAESATRPSRSLLEQTNLFEARGRRLGTFSGGMRQRFGIAVALIGNPRLIIVDEPTAGLDPAERVRFLNLLSELGENAVVILSTHIVEDVSDLCSRMAIIRQRAHPAGSGAAGGRARHPRAGVAPRGAPRRARRVRGGPPRAPRHLHDAVRGAHGGARARRHAAGPLVPGRGAGPEGRVLHRHARGGDRPGRAGGPGQGEDAHGDWNSFRAAEDA